MSNWCKLEKTLFYGFLFNLTPNFGLLLSFSSLKCIKHLGTCFTLYIKLVHSTDSPTAPFTTITLTQSNLPSMFWEWNIGYKIMQNNVKHMVKSVCGISVLVTLIGLVRLRLILLWYTNEGKIQNNTSQTSNNTKVSQYGETLFMGVLLTNTH